MQSWQFYFVYVKTAEIGWSSCASCAKHGPEVDSFFLMMICLDADELRCPALKCAVPYSWLGSRDRCQLQVPKLSLTYC